MKKSLSLIVSIAMVFSLFASVAFAAEKTAMDKFNELKAAGIFTGTGDADDAALGQEMDRGSAAVIVARLAQLDTSNPANPTFSDVNSSQPWYGYVEAAVKAGIIVGNGDGTFTPYDKVTMEQLAVMIAKTYAAASGTEIDLEATTDVEASDWAQPYIAAVLGLGLFGDVTDWSSNATREVLVNVTYEAYDLTNTDEPDKVSIASASAAGVKKVEVKLDKAVDTEKASFTLKKGSVTVVLDKTTWSDDKKTATLNLKNVKLTDGDYTVTLGGIDADTVATASASFKATDETVTKISFITAGDQLAYTKKAKVKLKAENQYGENASFSSTEYSVFTGYTGMNERVAKDNSGNLVVELDTNATGVNIIQGQSQLPITVYYNKTRVTVSKTFTVGNAPFPNKVELGDVQYDGDKKSLSSAGDVATVPITLYDQYGNPITADQDAAVTLTPMVQPYSANLTAEAKDFDSDNYYEVKVTLGKEEAKAATYNVIVYSGGSSATASFDVGAGRVATSLGFGEFSDVLAAGDGDKYVTLLAYDSEGNQLTTDEVVDNEDRINVSVNGPIADSSRSVLVLTGPNKGKIRIAGINPNTARQTVFITASISQIDSNDFKTLSLNVQDARVADTLVIDSASDDKAVLGASSKFKILVKDQYGEKLNNIGSDFEIAVTLQDLSSTGSAISVESQKSGATKVGTLASEASNATPTPIVYTGTEAGEFNEGFKFNTTEFTYGKAQFKAELISKAGATPATLKTVTQSIESINPAVVNLKYAVKDIGSLYAAVDNKALGTVAGGTPIDNPATSHLRKKVEIKVTDSSGHSVAFPDDLVQTVSTSDGKIAVYAADGTAPSQIFYVLGNKAGEATVTATVYSAKGEIVSASGKVTVKADPVAVDSISAGNGDIASAAAGTYDAYDLMDLKVVDNYGIEYKGDDINKHKFLIGITYTVTGVKGGGTVALDSATNEITITGTVTEFTLTAHAPNGKTASTLVY